MYIPGAGGKSDVFATQNLTGSYQERSTEMLFNPGAFIKPPLERRRRRPAASGANRFQQDQPLLSPNGTKWPQNS